MMGELPEGVGVLDGEGKGGKIGTTVTEKSILNNFKKERKMYTRAHTHTLLTLEYFLWMQQSIFNILLILYNIWLQ